MIREDLVQATAQPAASEGAVSDAWQPIETAPKVAMEEVIIAGLFPNGVPYVVCTFWNPQGHWNGWKLHPPTHWRPMPTFDGSLTAPLSQRQNETDSLRSERDALVAALTCFLDDPRFQVAVGGNPIAVEEMLAKARAALTASKATGERS
jgi:hypothetical protein